MNALFRGRLDLAFVAVCICLFLPGRSIASPSFDDCIQTVKVVPTWNANIPDPQSATVSDFVGAEKRVKDAQPRVYDYLDCAALFREYEEWEGDFKPKDHYRVPEAPLRSWRATYSDMSRRYDAWVKAVKQAEQAWSDVVKLRSEERAQRTAAEPKRLPDRSAAATGPTPGKVTARPVGETGLNRSAVTLVGMVTFPAGNGRNGYQTWVATGRDRAQAQRNSSRLTFFWGSLSQRPADSRLEIAQCEGPNWWAQASGQSDTSVNGMQREGNTSGETSWQGIACANTRDGAIASAVNLLNSRSGRVVYWELVLDFGQNDGSNYELNASSNGRLNGDGPRCQAAFKPNSTFAMDDGRFQTFSGGLRCGENVKWWDFMWARRNAPAAVTGY